MDIDITEKLRDKFGPKKRTIGRYSVSDLYAIKAGWLTLETYLTPVPPDFEAIKKMPDKIRIPARERMYFLSTPLDI